MRNFNEYSQPIDSKGTPPTIGTEGHRHALGSPKYRKISQV